MIATIVLENPGATSEKGANAFENPLGAVREVIKFYHTGLGSHPGKFVEKGLFLRPYALTRGRSGVQNSVYLNEAKITKNTLINPL